MNNLFKIDVMFYSKLLFIYIYIYCIYKYKKITVNPKQYTSIDQYQNISFH